MKIFFEKIRLIFDTQNWLWKYDFGTFWWTVSHQQIFFEKNPFRMLILGQKSCFLGPTIFKIPQPKWRYYVHTNIQDITHESEFIRNLNDGKTWESELFATVHTYYKVYAHVHSYICIAFYLTFFDMNWWRIFICPFGFISI